MRIIPAIDIIDGKCVRLSKGDYHTSKIYNEDPLEVAQMFQDFGIKFLHLVDLDGAKSSQVINYKTLEKLANKTQLKIDFGGGVKSYNDLKTVLNSGANQVTIGSVAAQNPELMLDWLKEFGPEKIILGADCKDRKIAINGWTEQSQIDIVAYIQKYQQNGVQYTVVTDIDKDGMLAGPSKQLYNEILAKTTISLIASGGVTTLDDVLYLRDLGCEATIIGKAIYEKTIDLKELSKLC